MSRSYNAIVVNKTDECFTVKLEQLEQPVLQPRQVRIDVHYSSINYKDALACSEHGNIVRQYPHIPGIDLAGYVIESSDDRFKAGDAVIATSYTIGVSEHGGFAEQAVINADYVIPIPSSLTFKQAMTIGTAGLTAAIAVLKLEKNGLSRKGESVVVTGATGGVGGHAIMLLHALGYHVTALTRKPESIDYLKALGASDILLNDTYISQPLKTLGKQRWEGAIDVVGGRTLSHLLPDMCYGASVAVCGLTGGVQFESTVLPLILRGVNIIGIDSVNLPYKQRKEVWQFIALLSDLYNTSKLIYKDINLEDVPNVIKLVLNGEIMGRYIINLKL